MLAVTLFAALAFAKPDFTGDWKMDPAKSDWGFLPAPEVLDRKITHKDPKLDVATKQSGVRGESKTESKLTTDGVETTVNMNGRETKATAKWDGDVLVVEVKWTNAQGDFALIERWKLAEDGKSISIEAKVTLPAGDVPLKIHLDKRSD